MKEKIFKVIVASFILISISLAYFVNINWLAFTAFVGLNLLQSAFTKFCLLEIILGKLGLKSEKEGCC